MIINNDRWCISEQAGRDIRNWLKFYHIFPYIWNCYRMDEDEVTRPSFWMMWSTCEWLRWWLLDSDAG